ncbi:MAG: bis(5'-nucleosyl)-tetraphosphatase (symmetrical) [Beggiatoa sp. IS2]|nr:MAG: bis(5'-nucleosyl)-tetraphosphatase (symmetrical) [Beggiatoa sp. IS2]
MATYVIGDIQGCYIELRQLLKFIHYHPNKDTLWCVGDLVNRGPHSLEVLRFIKGLGEKAVVVLGNHDLHLLAVAHGWTERLHRRDTLTAILQASDKTELLTWLRHRPLLHYDVTLKIAMIHAGLPPQWDIAQASQYAHEVEMALRGDHYQEYFNCLYGSKPRKWSEDLKGEERLRYITNCFTRLRYCSAEGELALEKKDAPEFTVHSPYQPWFSLPNRRSRETRIIFGHWSTLGYYTQHHVTALDTGCLWGGTLTALRLEDEQIYHVPCTGTCEPGQDF